ncbi:MAG: hypothetical protein ACPG77_11645 [Nannocystaceae bacterium]
MHSPDANNPAPLPVALSVTEQWVRATFIRFYADQVLAPEAARIDLTIASNRHPDRLRLHGVPANIRCQDLQDLLIRMFRLPATHTFEEQGFRVFLSYSLKHEGRAIEDTQLLGDFQQEHPDLAAPAAGLTFWTRMVYQELRRQGAYVPASPEEARERELAHASALEAYEVVYNQAWQTALANLTSPTS